MNSVIFLSNLYLEQGIGKVYVIVGSTSKTWLSFLLVDCISDLMA